MTEGNAQFKHRRGFSLSITFVIFYLHQLSSFNLGTLENSFVLLLTSVPLLASAVPAINTSQGPVGVPFFSRLTWIEADRRALHFQMAIFQPKSITISTELAFFEGR